MSKLIIADTQAAGNATDTVCFTMPAGYAGLISTIMAYNSTGGSLNLTIKVGRSATNTPVLTSDTIGATTATQYNKGSSKPITPLLLNAGDTLVGNGSGAGISIIFGGLRWTV